MDGVFLLLLLLWALVTALVLWGLRAGWLKPAGFVPGAAKPSRRELLLVSFSGLLVAGLWLLGDYWSLPAVIVCGYAVFAAGCLRVVAQRLYKAPN
ncbi:hypothetical protein LOC51_14125 [Rubrivivax sp. JA1024]|nr:hypothetical protein [Rubrivivax sp. JA1024]